MRTLNVRPAAICLVVVVLLGGGVHLLHAFQLRRQANALRIASERAEADYLILKLRGTCVAARESLSRKDASTVASDQSEESKRLRAAEVKNLDEAIDLLEGTFRKKSKDSNELPDLGPSAEEKNLEEAIHHLQSYGALVPKDRKGQLHLGLLYADPLHCGGDTLDTRGDKLDALAASSKVVEIARAATENLPPEELCKQLRLGQLHAETLGARAELPPHNARAAFITLEDVLRTADGSLSREELYQARRKLVVMAIWNGRLSDAEMHLKVLTDETPDDPELLDLGGQILFYDKKYDEAKKQFERAIERAPTQIDSYFQLANVLRSRLDKKAEAEEVLRDMIHRKLKDKDGKAVKDKDGKEVEVNAKSVAAFQKYANYLREERKFDEALVQANRVLELAPEDSVGLWIAGFCYLANGQYKTAEDYLNRGIRADKRSHVMYTVMADVKNRLGRHDEAIAVLRQGLENTKGTLGYVEILWDLVNSNIIIDRKFDEAEKEIKELRDLRYKPQRIEFLEARLAFMKNDWIVAKESFEKVLPKLHDDPNDRDLQKFAYLYLGQCYRQQGKVEEQIEAYLAALKIDPYFILARTGLAEIYLGRGNFSAAAEQYSILLRGPRPDSESALALARILIMMRYREDKEKRDWEPVDKLLDQIERQRALTPNVAVLKAEVLLAKDDPKDTDEHLTVAKQRGQAAKEYLEDCSKKFPKSVQVWLALINLTMYQAENTTAPGQKEQKWKQVSDCIDRAEQSLGDHPIIREKRASCAVRRKDPQQVAVLKKLGAPEGLGKMTDFERTHLWSSLAALSVQANDFDLARSYCRLVAEQDPKNVLVRYLLCDLNLRAFEKGQTPDLPELDKQLKEIEQLGGRGPYWLYGKAIRTLVQSKKKDPQLLMDARGYLKEAMEVRPDWSALAVLTGKICEMQDEPDQALEFYTNAVYRMGDRDSDMIGRAVRLLVARGRPTDIEEAKQLIDYLEKQKSPLLTEMNQQVAYVKVFTGDIAEAAEEVKNSVAADSKNYEDFLRQGQMYAFLAQRLKSKAQSAHRDLEAAIRDEKTSVEEKHEKSEGARQADSEMIKMGQRAVNALLKARALNPQADRVWIALVRLLVDVGQPDKARPLIPAARAALKGEQAPITLATCCELINDMGNAQAQFEAAAKASPQNSRVLRQLAAFYLRRAKLDLAEPFLKQIIALETPATLTDVCSARRALADVLVSRGDFTHLCQGMALIDENLRSKAPSIDDRRAKAHFLLADPRKEKIGEAIQAMEDLVKGTDATPVDYFNLAKLYLKKGDWNNYERHMLNVFGAQKATVQPAYLIFYINTLLERKQLDDADKWLQTLEKSAPNLFDTVRLRAEHHFLRGSYEAAGNLAMAFLDNPRAEPRDRGQQLLLVAQVMERFSDRLKAEGKRVIAGGFAEKADALFASLRSPRVSATGDIYFADYLARQKRIRECLQVLEQCWEKFPAETLRIPASVILHSRAADAAQYRQLEKILVAASNKAASNKSGHPISLLPSLAAVHAQQREYDKSIADYRQILAKEPGNYQVMNNLALNLARSGQNLDEALKLINDALAISGPLAGVLDSRAIIHIARQEPEKALEDLAAAIQDDGAPEQYFHQAWAYLLLGKKTEASAAFATAQKKGLNPNDLDPREVSVYDRLKEGP